MSAYNTDSNKKELVDCFPAAFHGYRQFAYAAESFLKRVDSADLSVLVKERRVTKIKLDTGIAAERSSYGFLATGPDGNLMIVLNGKLETADIEHSFGALLARTFHYNLCHKVPVDYLNEAYRSFAPEYYDLFSVRLAEAVGENNLRFWLKSQV